MTSAPAKSAKPRARVELSPEERVEYRAQKKQRRNQERLDAELRRVAGLGLADEIAPLLAQGASAGPDSIGQTPLLIAARSGRELCVRRLIPWCDPNAVSATSGLTALGEAMSQGYLACFDLLAPISDVNVRNPHGSEAKGLAPGHTLLMRAVQAGDSFGTLHEHFESRGRVKKSADFWVQKLLPLSDALARDAKGQTALMLAAERADDAKCAEILLAAGGANLQDHEGRTALMRAAAAGCMASVHLLAATADASLVDRHGRTALMHAATYGSKPVLALLPLSDPDAFDAHGRNALAWAAMEQKDGVVPILGPICAAAPPDLDQSPLAQAFSTGKSRLIEAVSAFSADADLLWHGELVASYGSKRLPLTVLRHEAAVLRAAAVSGQAAAAPRESEAPPQKPAMRL
jgi:ankyrin repeat protein